MEVRLTMALPRLLLLAPLGQGSGNLSTITRIRSHFESHGLSCILSAPDDFHNPERLLTYIHNNQIGLAIGVHAYKAGTLLRDIRIPYMLILGGTDVNENYRDPVMMDVMTQAVTKASHIVAFSESMMANFYKHWPNYSQLQTSIIQQAVQVGPSDFSIQSYINNNIPSKVFNGNDLDQALKPCDQHIKSHDQNLKSHDQSMESHDQNMESHDQSMESHDINDATKLFILVGGIRPVKNPLYLVKDFSAWHVNKRQDCYLLIIGPQVDKDYFSTFEKEIASLPGVLYIPGLSLADTHAAIQNSFALVNSSDSEGMAVTILEGMCLSTPVIVRAIPGNTDIVQDSISGLVYTTPQEFLQKAESLLENSELGKTITHNASNYVSQKHSLKMEESMYMNIVENILKEN